MIVLKIILDFNLFSGDLPRIQKLAMCLTKKSGWSTPRLYSWEDPAEENKWVVSIANQSIHCKWSFSQFQRKVQYKQQLDVWGSVSMYEALR